jgi:hypothetical protein
MVRDPNEKTRECLRRADDCARHAAAQTDPKLRQDFLDMQGRWLRLASSYELGERLTTSTNSIKPSAR